MRREAGLRRLYGRLPEDVRRMLRPLNLADETASFLPPRARGLVHGIAEAGRRLERLRSARYDVRLVSGRAAGSAEPLAALLGMDDLSARYWTGVLFAGTPTVEVLGTVRTLDVARAARGAPAAAELTLWQVPWPVPVRDGGVRVPSWVPLCLATDRSLADVIAGDRSGRAARKNDVRRVGRLGLEARVCTDAASFERFHRELYLPYVHWRFDDLAVPVQPHVFRQVRRHGVLLLLESADGPVSGAVVDRAGDAATVLVFGVKRDGPIPAGAALEACYYHVVRYAVEHGVRALSLGACRPVLTDGVLRYKRKWGARIGAPATWDTFALRYANTPGVRAALAAAPLVVDTGGGRLAALVGIAGDARRDPLAYVDTIVAPGIADVACLVDGDVHVVARPASRTDALVRAVLPGDVWPRAARMPAAGDARRLAAA